MRADLLHVFVPYNNPLRWNSRLANYQKVEQHLLHSGVQLTTIECAYGDRPFELPDHPHITRRRVRTRDVLWHKENLNRIGAAGAAADAEYFCFLDADTWMADPNWGAETVHELQIHEVAQISSDLVFLGPRGEHISHGVSITSLYKKNRWHQHDGHMSGPWGYPGLGWAFRREAYDKLGGLLDICILGSGDYHMALALLGLPEPTSRRPTGANVAYNRVIDRWRERAAEVVKADVGLVTGTALHFFHGTYKNRGYETRPSILVRHQFDPDVDIVRDSQGVINLSGNKPKMRDDIRAYFASRNEDSIDF